MAEEKDVGTVLAREVLSAHFKNKWKLAWQWRGIRTLSVKVEGIRRAWCILGTAGSLV